MLVGPRARSTFDAYAEHLNRTDIRVLLTARDRAGWSIADLVFGRMVLQFGFEGGANVKLGAMPSDVVRFQVQTSAGSDIARLNGRTIGRHDLVVLPPGRNFVFASREPHQWISVSLPIDAVVRSALRVSDDVTAPVGTDVGIISTLPVLVKRIEAIATAIKDTREMPASDIEQTLIDVLCTAVALRAGEGPRPPRSRRMASEQVVHRALEFIRSHTKSIPHVDDLCRSIGTTDRSLRRVFHVFFGVGPASFLKLYQLNEVRWALRNEISPELTITRLLASYSVTEFGRFAGEYRALFGELPSDTRRYVKQHNEQRARR